MLTFSTIDPKTRAAAERRIAKLRAARDHAIEAYQKAVRSLPVAEDGRQYRMERRIQEIVLQMETLGDLMPGDLAHNLRTSRATIHRCLRVCVERGILKAKGFGLYALADDHISVKETEGVKAFNRKVLGDTANAYPEKPSQRPRNRKKLPGR